jgi:ABC-type transport system involved in multi-copper enzyme maturation permease subunit
VTVVNAAQSKITSLTAQTDYDENPIPNTNASNPAIIYSPYYEDVNKLTITILKTSDGSQPSYLQLAIFGCAKPTKGETGGQMGTPITSITPSSKSFLLESKNVWLMFFFYSSTSFINYIVISSNYTTRCFAYSNNSNRCSTASANPAEYHTGRHYTTWPFTNRTNSTQCSTNRNY